MEAKWLPSSIHSRAAVSENIHILSGPGISVHPHPAGAWNLGDLSSTHEEIEQSAEESLNKWHSLFLAQELPSWLKLSQTLKKPSWLWKAWGPAHADPKEEPQVPCNSSAAPAQS